LREKEGVENKMKRKTKNMTKRDERFETANAYYQYLRSKRADAPTEISSMTWAEIIEFLVERQLEKLPEHQRAAARASWERTNKESAGEEDEE
jgi:hypothetical protein